MNNRESFDIWVMNADGSNMVKLNNKISAVSPAWSPDGSKIAFGLGPVNKIDIWVMNADGSNKINLTNKLGDYWGPAWSPDGSKIAFVSQQNENKINFFVMNADGSNKINLTGN
jgi:Tol biopolymer transport system component